MSDRDKAREKLDQSPPEPSRRAFLNKFWLALGIIAVIEFVGIVIAYLRPNRKQFHNDYDEGLMEAGPVDGFPLHSVTPFVRGKFYLCRMADGGFLAVSRKCTHLGCTVPWLDEAQKFACPCHGSAFDIRGEVISPPASRALDIFPVFIENQIVKVHTNKPLKRSAFRPNQVVYSKKAQT